MSRSATLTATRGPSQEKKGISRPLNTIVIVNPKAGKRVFLRLFLPQVIGIFDENRIRYRVYYTRRSGHAAHIVSRNRARLDFVTVFGGDGTIREVVKGMGERPIPIGIIPFGTVNVLALDLGLSFNPILATKTIVQGHTRRIDLGYLNDEPFLLMASTGIDALAVHNVDLRAKRLIGKIAYLLSAIWSAFLYQPRRIKVYLEDQRVRDRGYLAVVANSRFYGGRFSIDDEASIDDGLFNVVVFKKRSLLDIFRLLMGVLTHTQRRMNDLSFYQSRKVLITSRSWVKMQMDGEKAPPPPAHIRLKERFLTIFVPPAHRGGLTRR